MLGNARDNSDMYNTGTSTVTHDKQLVIESSDQANFLSSVKVIAHENELKPGVIKVETQFWYHFRLL
jgi:hypothetical protein